MTFKAKMGIIATGLFTTGTMLTALTSALLLTSTASYAKDKDHKDDIMRLALQSSETTMTQAIAAFRSNYAGTIVEIELDDEDHMLVYEIKAINLDAGEKHQASYTLNNLTEVEYYHKSLKVLGFSKLDDEDVAAIESVNQPGAVSIDKAIEIANAHNSSHIESIELEHKRGLTYYEVEYIDGSPMRRLLIDAASGEAIPSINRK